MAFPPQALGCGPNEPPPHSIRHALWLAESLVDKAIMLSKPEGSEYIFDLIPLKSVIYDSIFCSKLEARYRAQGWSYANVDSWTCNLELRL